MSWVTVAIGGMTAMNQIQQGRHAASQAEIGALQSEGQAKAAEADAIKTAEIIRRAGRRQVGQANASYAAAGVQVGQGSAAEVERAINVGVEHDAFQAILEGDRKALGLQTDAKMQRIDGGMRKTAGMVNAVGTVLSTGYSAYSKWNTSPSTGDGLSQGDRRKLGVS